MSKVSALSVISCKAARIVIVFRREKNSKHVNDVKKILENQAYGRALQDASTRERKNIFQRWPTKVQCQ